MKVIPGFLGVRRIGGGRVLNAIAAATLLSGLICGSVFGQSQRTDAHNARSKPPQLYRIAGAVTNSATSETVPGVTLTLYSGTPPHITQIVESDAEGHFAFDPVPAGKNGLLASRRGFMTSFFNEHDMYSSAIVTGEGLDTEHIPFHINPGAMIRGFVRDDAGEPVEGAQVLLVRKTTRGGLGERMVKSISDTTDDTGFFEDWNLVPGTYFLAVKASPWFALHPSQATPNQTSDSASDESRRLTAALDVAYPITYYDGITDERAATPIPVRSGDRIQADVTLHAVPALHLTVHRSAANQQDQPPNSRIWLKQTVFGDEEFAQPFFGVSAGAGMTEFTGIAPGHYSLMEANPLRATEIDTAGSQDLDLSSGVPVFGVDLKIRMADGSVTPQPLVFVLVPDDLVHRPIEAQMTEKSQVHLDAIPPGKWIVLISSKDHALAVASIQSGARIQADSRFEMKDRALSLTVFLASGKSSIEGFATRDGKGQAGAMIVLVPKDPAARLAQFRRDQSDSDGSFQLKEIVPGDYTLVAIEDGWDLNWARSETTRRYLPGGLAITITDASERLIKLAAPIVIQSR